MLWQSYRKLVDIERAAGTCLLTNAEISDMEGLEKTHLLNPNAKRINKSLGDLTGLTGFGFNLIEIEPGHETTEHHRHYHEDECVFVLAGNGSAYLEDEAHPIGPGDFIGYRKGGQAHSIQNKGDETLRCIVVGERLSHDVGDYPRWGKRIYRNVGLPWSLLDLSEVQEVVGSVGKNWRGVGEARGRSHHTSILNNVRALSSKNAFFAAAPISIASSAPTSSFTNCQG